MKEKISLDSITADKPPSLIYHPVFYEEIAIPKRVLNYSIVEISNPNNLIEQSSIIQPKETKNNQQSISQNR